MDPMHAIPAEQIRRTARGALRAAGIDIDTPLPVPLAAIATAAGLHKEALYDLGAQQDLPPGLRQIFKKIQGKVLGALSVPEKRIYIDTSLAPERSRFTEAHEIGHSALAWHPDAYFGDTHHTLDVRVEASLEIEANAFAADLLFALDRFGLEADNYRPSLDVPLALTAAYGTSAHATIRRYVEQSKHELALIVAGRYTVGAGELRVPVWHYLQSDSYLKRFGPVAQSVGTHLGQNFYPELPSLLGDFSSRADECIVTLETSRGATRLIAHGFNNGHVTLVLLQRKKPTLGRPLKLVGPDGQPLD